MKLIPGQIWLADLGPPHARHTQEPTRAGPVIIASIEPLNDALATIIVFPISKSVYDPKDPNVVVLKRDKRNNLDYDSAVLPMLLRGIVKSRLQHSFGMLTSKQLARARDIVRTALGLGATDP